MKLCYVAEGKKEDAEREDQDVCFVWFTSLK